MKQKQVVKKKIDWTSVGVIVVVTIISLIAIVVIVLRG
jgi:competence protein ComGC